MINEKQFTEIQNEIDKQISEINSLLQRKLDNIENLKNIEINELENHCKSLEEIHIEFDTKFQNKTTKK